MAGEIRVRRKSSSQLLAELKTLSQSLSAATTTRSRSRRSNSVALPRDPDGDAIPTSDPTFKPQPSRMSTSPYKHVRVDEGSSEKKGIWNWKPIRAISHIGMHKIRCLFSVEVVGVQGVPTSMNGLRLSVCVRKKETKNGAVQTMAARVLQRAADFEETLFMRCHVYCTGSLKFEPRPLLIYVYAIDAPEIDFGKHSVDLSFLLQESITKNSQICQWDTSFALCGKAKGGELILKLGFQIMDKDGGGLPIYGQISSSFARKQSKFSFSVPSPRMLTRTQASSWSARTDFHCIDHLNLDEPPPTSLSSSLHRFQDLDFPEFEVVDKGVESTYGDSQHNTKALKSEERLDADDENVTMEFLQKLEQEESNKKILNKHHVSSEETDGMVFVPDLGKGLGCVVQTKNGGYLAAVNPVNAKMSRNEIPKLAMQLSKPLLLPSQNSGSGFDVFRRMSTVGIEELSSQVSHTMPIDELVGKTAEQIAFEGIASAIIQGRTKLEGASSSAARTIQAVKTMATAMSVARKERISTGIWCVQEEPATLDEILSLAMQKIEGMAVEALKIQADMADDVAPFDVSPLVSSTSTVGEKDPNRPLTAAIPFEDWLRNESTPGIGIKEGEEEGEPTVVTLSLVVQLRDPVRRYEAVGGPLVVLIQATAHGKDKYQLKFKLASLHVGGLKVWTTENPHVWDAEKQRLTAMQWLVGYGFVKAGKKGKHLHAKGPDTLWSISSRMVANMWLNSMRNPDIKFPKA